MNTEKLIKKLALEITPHYAYGTYYSLNKITDRMRSQKRMPACLHLQTSSGSVSLDDGAYYSRERKTPRVQVGFADAVKFDQDPEATIAVIDSLLQKCSQLVEKMNMSGHWEPIDGFDYEVLYNTQDANLVFVLASFNATEAEGRCLG